MASELGVSSVPPSERRLVKDKNLNKNEEGGGGGKKKKSKNIKATKGTQEKKSVSKK